MIKLLAFLISFNSFAIISGVSTPSDQQRVLKIQFNKINVSIGGICTATAISKTKLLTAGHCVKSYIKSRPSSLKLKINSKNYSILKIDVLDNYLELQKKYDDAISNNKPFANELKILSEFDVAIITVVNNFEKDIKITDLYLGDVKSGEAKLCGYGNSFFNKGKYLGNDDQNLLCGNNKYMVDLNYLYIEGNIIKSSVLSSVSSSMTAPGDSGSPLFNLSGQQIGVLSGITKIKSGAATSFYVKLSGVKKFLLTHL